MKNDQRKGSRAVTVPLSSQVAAHNKRASTSIAPLANKIVNA